MQKGLAQRPRLKAAPVALEQCSGRASGPGNRATEMGSRAQEILGYPGTDRALAEALSQRARRLRRSMDVWEGQVCVKRT